MTVLAPALRSAGIHARRSLGLSVDVFRLALGFLIILNVSRLHQHWGWMAVFRPAMLMVLLAGVYAFLAPRQLSTTGLFQTRPARLVVAFFVFACVSAPFGLSLGSSARFILDVYLKVVLGALLMIVAIRNSRDLYTLVWSYVAACGVLAYFSIYVFGLSKAGSQAERLSDLYTFDANDVGLIMVIGLPLALLVFQTARGAGKLLAATIIVGIGVTLARTGSRGAFLGLLATGLALLFLLQTVPIWKRVFFVLATAVTLSVSAPPGYWDQMSTILKPKDDYNWTSTDGRKEVTKRGLSYMLSYPVFGLGIHNFYRAECIDPVSTKVRLHTPGTGIRCSAPHNSYIEAGAELGVPGLIIWCMLVFGGIRSMLRLRRRMPLEWQRGDPEQRFLYLSCLYLAVCLAGFSVGSFFVSFAFSDPIYIVAALMAGTVVSVEERLAVSSVANGTELFLTAPGPRQRSWGRDRTGLYRTSVYFRN